jgi:hypothetical protein
MHLHDKGEGYGGFMEQLLTVGEDGSMVSNSEWTGSRRVDVW